MRGTVCSGTDIWPDSSYSNEFEEFGKDKYSQEHSPSSNHDSLFKAIKSGKKLLEKTFSGEEAGNAFSFIIRMISNIMISWKQLFMNILGRLRNLLTKWANHLKVVEPIADIIEDLGDGVKLCKIVEALAGKKIIGVNKRAQVPTGTGTL